MYCTLIVLTSSIYRTLSTLQNHSVPIAARVTVSKDESRDFMAIFPGEHSIFLAIINMIMLTR